MVNLVYLNLCDLIYLSQFFFLHIMQFVVGLFSMQFTELLCIQKRREVYIKIRLPISIGSIELNQNKTILSMSVAILRTTFAF